MSVSDIFDDGGWTETRSSGISRQVGGGRLLLLGSVETGVTIAQPGTAGMQGLVIVGYRDLAELTAALGEMQRQLRGQILSQQAQAREDLVRRWMDGQDTSELLQHRAWELMHHYSSEAATRLIQNVAQGGYRASEAEQVAARTLLESQTQAGVT